MLETIKKPINFIISSLNSLGEAIYRKASSLCASVSQAFECLSSCFRSKDSYSLRNREVVPQNEEESPTRTSYGPADSKRIDALSINSLIKEMKDPMINGKFSFDRVDKEEAFSGAASAITTGIVHFQGKLFRSNKRYGSDTNEAIIGDFISKTGLNLDNSQKVTFTHLLLKKPQLEAIDLFTESTKKALNKEMLYVSEVSSYDFPNEEIPPEYETQINIVQNRGKLFVYSKQVCNLSELARCPNGTSYVENQKRVVILSKVDATEMLNGSDVTTAPMTLSYKEIE